MADLPQPLPYGRALVDKWTPPGIWNRHDWGAQPPSHPLMRLQIPTSRVTIHHTATPLNGSPGPTLRIGQAWQMHHGTPNPSWDLDYHAAVDATGATWEGRAKQPDGSLSEGAATLDDNPYEISIVAIGNFADASQGNIGGGDQPTVPMLTSIAWLIALSRALGRTTIDSDVEGHSHYCQTACPGNRMDTHLWWIRLAAARWI